MPQPYKVKYIVIHCTAGYGHVESIKRFWKEKLGWRSPGYHRIIDLDGKVHELAGFKKYTNGVKGFNGKSIHISYIGGVNPENYKRAMDSRTFKQKKALCQTIENALQWLESFRVSREAITIQGHRDFSPDQNGDGKISEWERIKECPSFDAKLEYNGITVC